MSISLRPGQERDRDDLARALIDLQYTRNDMDFHRGTFRVHGDVLDIFPANAMIRQSELSFSVMR